MKINKLDEAAMVKKQLDGLVNLREWAEREDSSDFALALLSGPGHERSCDLERDQFTRVLQTLIKECEEELVKLGVEL